MNPRLRERVLCEWRGLPQRTAAPDRTVPVADAVTRLMHRLGMRERLDEAEVQRCWQGIVGEFIATHSAPCRLRDGVLFVQVVQPTLHFELSRVWKTEILKKLKVRFGSKIIRDIRFRIG
jgi:predicted nucleic acid-binding Zn ribbon protein